ncbi:hypothetical protein FPQ18DRAFT_310366 [Pyronema domesticum]|uniref:Ribosomal lysine N-methyltransferase 4 n=1 Tax=Pyronema omphalodes (strain CBS 100304) TaxID=1076935 RepID=U4L4P2_PYROM|nr:hypothetical protein FPQ18DRAFT_310366 [Pyronema domesticum]CCX07273.1 Similar to Ribosomal N-lysine methyltransferase 4; acc. no. Q12504 [Pyronema omphalodes CBS 100304]
MTTTNDEFEQRNANFMQWLVSSQHAEVNPKCALTDLRSIGGGRGVVALSPMEEDELVFRIPRASALTLETSNLKTLLPEAEVAALDPWLVLILVLIFETRPSSPWAPYLDLLPTDFNSLMYWSGEELSQLRGSAVLDKIGKADADDIFLNKLLPVVQRNESAFTETCLRNVPTGMGFDEHFLITAHRMGSIIMSYSFDLEVVHENKPAKEEEEEEDSDDDEEEKEHYKAMVPLADMLNADADRNNCRLFETATMLEMKTIAPIEAGAELFNDYGPLPRSDLLRRYGYVTSNYAQYDVVEISAPLLVQVAGAGLGAEDRQARIDVLLEEGVLDDSFDLDRSLEIPEEIIVTVRTLLLSKLEYKKFQEKGKLPKPMMEPAVAKVLREVVDKRLKEYPTTLREDQKLLEGEMRGRWRIATEVRMGEKEILVAVKESLKTVATNKRSADAEETKGGKKVKA